MTDKMEQVKDVVDLKAVEAQLMKNYDVLDTFISKSEKELEDAKSISAETKNAVEKLAQSSVELGDKIADLEQKQAQRFDEEPITKTLGDTFVESEVYKRAIESGTGTHKLELKTTIVNAYSGGMAQPLVAGDRLNMVWHEPNRPLRIRDVVPGGRTSSNIVWFTKESSFTNNAAHQVAGSPIVQTDETALSESAIAFTSDSEQVATVGHFIPVSLQALGDSDFIASYINNRLVYGLKYKEDTELITGAGTLGTISGINTNATAYSNSASPNYTSTLDILRDGRRQLEVANYTPSVVILNPLDWANIELLKATTNEYLMANPQGLLSNQIWGMRVVISNSQTAGTWCMFDPQVYQIFDREDASVAVAYENGTDFVNLAATIRCYERFAFVNYSTSGCVKGTGI